MNFELMVRLGAHFVQHLYRMFKIGTLQGKSWLCCHLCDQQKIATFMLACVELVLAICILGVIYEVKSAALSGDHVHFSTCDLLSATEPLIRFLWNSMLVLWKRCRSSATFVKISSETLILYLGASVNFYPYCPRFLTNFVTIWHKIFAHSATDNQLDATITVY